VKHFFTVLLILLVFCVFTSCSQPVGSLNDSGGNGVVLLLVHAEKKEYRYDLNQVFDPVEDLQISFTGNGYLESIYPLDPDISITIFDNVGSDTVLSILEPGDPVIVFSQAGKHHVKVTYKGYPSHPERYTIIVKGADDDPGGSGDPDFGTLIIW